jgi:hypothetical protein
MFQHLVDSLGPLVILIPMIGAIASLVLTAPDIRKAIGL